MNAPSLPDAETASTELAAGTVVDGRYEVVRLLGAGGMGAVYEARHKDIGREVALKVLHPSLASEKQFVQRFLQEARTANDVRHRNIVQILDFGLDRGRPYMVLEYLRGEPLSALLERERATVTPGRIVRLMDPVLRALTFAHARGVVHRDIKPENIFLALEDDEPAAEPVPKILDFGIAKRSSDGGTRLTSTQMSLGTPAYMAPEQVTGARDVTDAADQYAVGVLVFEALTGCLPHDGESYNALIIAKATQPPAHLATLRPGIDPGFAAVVMRALAPAPADRFPSIEALRQALAPYATLHEAGAEVDPARATLALGATMASGPVPAVLPQATSASMVMTPPVTVSTQSAPAPARGASRWLFAAGALVALAAGGAAIALRARVTAASASEVRVTSAAATRVAAPVTPAQADAVFRIRVTPASAEVLVDGQLAGRGEVELRRPRDARRYQLVLRAPGFEPVQDVLVADGDARIERALAPVTANVASTTAGAGAPTTPVEEPPARDGRRGRARGRNGARERNDPRHPSILRSLE